METSTQAIGLFLNLFTFYISGKLSNLVNVQPNTSLNMATLTVYLSSHLHAAFVVLYDFVATIQDACKM